MASFFDRLKERKLFQWALAYAAGAWVFLEATGFVSDRFGWPEFFVRALTLLAGVGFFVTLVLAWYHGERGRQRVSGPELVMVSALLVVAGVALSTLGDREGPAQVTTGDLAEQERARSEDQRPRIAVLPLDNLSPDPNDAFFAAGVQEDLTSTLSRIPSLAVVSRSSLEQYRDPANRPALRQIAEELGADYLLEGSARVGGDSVRITVQLIQGDTDVHLWAENFDAAYSPDAYFGLQAEIVQRIAYQLRAAIAPEDLHWLEAVPTESLEALEAFMRGNEAYRSERLRGTFTEWTEMPSIRWYESAIQLDPGFSLALARLALSGTYTFAYTGAAPERVEGLARRALSVSPDLPDAQLALARANWASGRVEDALAQLAAAQKTTPGDLEIALQLASYREQLGDLDAAIEAYERLERMHPRDPLVPRRLQYAYITAHRYDDALDAADRQAALTPTPDGRIGLRRVFIHIARGDRERAAAATAELLRDGPGAFYAHREDGPQRVAERLLDAEQRVRAFDGWLTSCLTCKDEEGQLRWWYFANAAIHEAALGRSDLARAHWDSVRIKLEGAALTMDAPGETAGQRLVSLIHAYMGLEERSAAMEGAGRLLEEFGATAEGSPEGPSRGSACRSVEARLRCAVVARVYAHFGEHEAAIDLLEELLPAPSWLTVPILEVDPIWDPLRDHPRFQALLETPPSVN
jgi:serine/threonine-protein kinase